MYPWHGIWYLVSAEDGHPAPGPVTVGTETLAGQKPALAYAEATLSGAPVTVYSYSLDRGGASACAGACAVTWPPRLTTGKPKIAPTSGPNHIVAQDLGVTRRADGTEQVTYGGKPLYLYSGERYVFVTGALSYNGTAGNGKGLHGPNGGTFSVVYLSQ